MLFLGMSKEVISNGMSTFFEYNYRIQTRLFIFTCTSNDNDARAFIVHLLRLREKESVLVCPLRGFQIVLNIERNDHVGE